MGASLRLERVSRYFGEIPALAELTLEVEGGEFLAILGPSGSGKTTTLNLIAGFDHPTTGEVLLDGHLITELPAHRRGVGMVFQGYALFPHMTVAENIGFPLRMRRVPTRDIHGQVTRALSLVRLGELGDRYPAQLSGGQQQRVALARALVYQPSILLMDEPLGALDRKLRGEMQSEIKRIHRELGTTVVYVTHDQDEALSMADRVAVLHRGRLEQHGTPREVYERPKSPFVATFVGDANFLDGVVATEGGTPVVHLALGLSVPLDAGACRFAPGDRVVLVARPEHLRVRPAPAEASGFRVHHTSFLGDAVKSELHAGDRQLIAKTPLHRGEWVPGAGAIVSVAIEAAQCAVFPAGP
jgi:spermidine/putrescine ABC transporter ATP-binding subunit